MEWLRNIESSRSTRIARQYMSIHIVGRTIAWVVVPGALRELDEDHISVMALCLFGDDRSNSAGVTPQSGQFCRAGRGAGRPIAGPEVWSPADPQRTETARLPVVLALGSMAHATWWRRLPRVWGPPEEVSFHDATMGLRKVAKVYLHSMSHSGRRDGILSIRTGSRWEVELGPTICHEAMDAWAPLHLRISCVCVHLLILFCGAISSPAHKIGVILAAISIILVSAYQLSSYLKVH